MTPEEQGQRFDEKAALAELERLRESIQAARRARQRSSDEFEAFVKSFRTPASTPISERPTPTSRVSEAPHAASESINRSLRSPDPSPAEVTVPPNTDSFDDKPALPASPVARRYRVNIRLFGILVVIAVIALGLVSTRWRRGVPPRTSVKAVSHSAAITPNSPPPLQSALPSPAASGVAIELRVVRPVWMRVVVDGRKDVEGTVQAGEPLHFTGDRSIVVRVGNGGDVLVKTGDREESFGDTGQPRTRTFSKQ